MRVYIDFVPPSERPALDVRTARTGTESERKCSIPKELAERMRSASTAFYEAKQALLRHLEETGQWDDRWPPEERAVGA